MLLHRVCPVDPAAQSGEAYHPALAEWAGRKSDGELAAYRAEKNAASIDGLPALDP